MKPVSTAPAPSSSRQRDGNALGGALSLAYHELCAINEMLGHKSLGCEQIDSPQTPPPAPLSPLSLLAATLSVALLRPEAGYHFSISCISLSASRCKQSTHYTHQHTRTHSHSSLPHNMGITYAHTHRTYASLCVGFDLSLPAIALQTLPLLSDSKRIY